MAIERQLRVHEPEDEAPPVLKVAFATSDLVRVDQHFGAASRFAIHSIGPGESRLLEVAEFGELARDGHEGKLLEKFVVLEGCAAVYCQAVGSSAVRQLLGLGVQPLKVPSGSGIAMLINQVQAEMNSGVGGWVARALSQAKRDDPGRFDAMLDEGWDDE